MKIKLLTNFSVPRSWVVSASMAGAALYVTANYVSGNPFSLVDLGLTTMTGPGLVFVGKILKDIKDKLTGKAPAQAASLANEFGDLEALSAGLVGLGTAYRFAKSPTEAVVDTLAVAGTFLTCRTLINMRDNASDNEQVTPQKERKSKRRLGVD